MIQLPVLVGLKVCHEAIVEEATKRVTLVNCFRRLAVPSVPSAKTAFKVCFVLTDGMGKSEMSVSIKRCSTLKEVWFRPFSVEFSDPMNQRWFAVPLSNCRFPEEGRYQVELDANNELLGLCVFEVYVKGDEHESSS
jgi:hypothetical protein